MAEELAVKVDEAAGHLNALATRLQEFSNTFMDTSKALVQGLNNSLEENHKVLNELRTKFSELVQDHMEFVAILAEASRDLPTQVELGRFVALSGDKVQSIENQIDKIQGQVGVLPCVAETMGQTESELTRLNEKARQIENELARLRANLAGMGAVEPEREGLIARLRRFFRRGE